MGLFRLTLALCVVLGHGLQLAIPAATADIAVQTFYIVSGFYGARANRAVSQPIIFFTNRLLALPAYLVVAAPPSRTRFLMEPGRIDFAGLLSCETHFAPLDLLSKSCTA